MVERGSFTLGEEVDIFEKAYAEHCGSPHGIGVASGTDALFLPLKALGITGSVITTPYTFYATTASIVNAGCQPIFVDVRDDFNIDPEAIEAAITPDVECIMPVHWGGRPCNMTAITQIAKNHGLAVIEDAAQAFGSTWDGKSCGSWGNAGAFSLHPLKIVNGWLDAGVITTHEAALADKLRLLRNHGLRNRDTVEMWGYNSRIDTVEAVIAHHVLNKVDDILVARRAFAARLNDRLSGIDEIYTAPMPEEANSNFYLFTFLAQRRDELVAYLIQRGVECKIHYPVPIHRQPAAIAMWGEQSFPVAERCADETISLPIHEFLSMEDADFMADAVRSFYKGK